MKIRLPKLDALKAAGRTALKAGREILWAMLIALIPSGMVVAFACWLMATGGGGQ